MTITRRGFFRSVLAAAAAGTLLTDPTVAAAAALFPKDRITVAINGAKALVAYQQKHLNGSMSGWNQSPEYATYLKQGDAWLDQMLADFTEEADIDETQMLFDGLIQIESLDDQKLYTISAGIVPIALVRLLIQKYRQPFHMSKMAGFGRFADRYRHAIMDDGSVAYNSLRVSYQGSEEKKAYILAIYTAHRAAHGTDTPIVLTVAQQERLRSFA